MNELIQLPSSYILCLAILGLAGCTPQVSTPDAGRPAPANPGAASETPKAISDLSGRPPARIPEAGQPVAIEPSPAPARTEGFKLGINLAPVTDYTREWAVVDVFKTSRPWFAAGDAKVAFDDNGNPLPAAGRPVQTLMVRELDGHYPGGVYTATYSGAGKVEMNRYDVKNVVKDAPGRIEANVSAGDGGIQLVIAESDPKNPVRDIHVWTPGFERSDSAFHPLFRERLKPFQVLRFMDWQRINNSLLRQWPQRPKPADPRYTTEAGAPLEVMIDLANTCNASPWFCIPHQADDNFVAEFAETVKARLKPNLKVYVEYSNEVWNFQFAQTRWAQEQGERLKLGKPEYLRFYARRSVEVFKIWEKVFGGRDRLVRVLGSQFGNPWVSEQVLTWEDAGRNADALAVGPYFGVHFGDPKGADEVAKKTIGQLLDDLDAEVMGENRELIRKQAAAAANAGVSLVAYEGGQHLAGFNGAENNEALAKLFMAVNRNPRMYDLYVKHLANWTELGGGLYVAYNNVSRPTKWGSWGVLEYQDQPVEDAPKYRALLSFVAPAGPKR